MEIDRKCKKMREYPGCSGNSNKNNIAAFEIEISRLRCEERQGDEKKRRGKKKEVSQLDPNCMVVSFIFISLKKSTSTRSRTPCHLSCRSRKQGYHAAACKTGG